MQNVIHCVELLIKTYKTLSNFAAPTVTVIKTSYIIDIRGLCHKSFTIVMTVASTLKLQ